MRTIQPRLAVPARVPSGAPPLEKPPGFREPRAEKVLNLQAASPHRNPHSGLACFHSNEFGNEKSGAFFDLPFKQALVVWIGGLHLPVYRYRTVASTTYQNALHGCTGSSQISRSTSGRIVTQPSDRRSSTHYRSKRSCRDRRIVR